MTFAMHSIDFFVVKNKKFQMPAHMYMHLWDSVGSATQICIGSPKSDKSSKYWQEKISIFPSSAEMNAKSCEIAFKLLLPNSLSFQKPDFRVRTRAIILIWASITTILARAF